MKRFYNNTLIGGACSKALRVVALLCVLLGVSTSAWAKKYYIDASCIDGVYKVNWLQDKDSKSILSNASLSQTDIYSFETSYIPYKIEIQYQQSSWENRKIEGLDIGSHNCFVFKVENGNLTYTVKTYNAGDALTCSSSGGGAVACTPSATITGASYDGTKINLSGRLSQVCDNKITYYGWQYKTSANGDWEAEAITGAGNNSSQVAKDYSKSWDNGGNLVAGTTYYFRAYATYDAKTWYSDNKILSVTIPNGSGGTGEADCSGVVYLNPGVWDTDGNPRYEAYFWADNISGIWVTMTATNSEGDCSGLYYAKIPEGCNKVIFVRMDPSKPEGTFDSKWDQTGDLTLQQNKNCYNIPGWENYDDTKWGTTDCTDGCTPAEQPSTNVLLSREAIVNKSAKTAQLFGYLKSIKAPDCPSSAITDYGFFYCMVNDGDTPCLPLPTSSSTKLQVSPSDALLRGEEFTATVGLIKEPSDALQDGKTYYYRAYAKIDDKYILSGEIRSFSTDPCIPQYGGLSDKYVDGTPIVYTINADPAFAANDCKLHFKSLQDAIDHLKKTKDRDNDYKYVDGSYNLLQPVEMRVVYYDDTPYDDEKAYAYRGTTAYGMTAGNVTPTNVNLIEGINKTASNSANTLTIKAGTSKAKPWIHHIVIRNSKNIVLDSLCIYSDPTGIKDNALEIDVNSTSWPNIQPNFENANIVIQNSIIGSSGFTGVHVSGYDGITFKGNEIEASFTADAKQRKNTITWGASAKFVACKNIKFIQNNFRGSQPTLLWLQDSQNALFMNNVFWNTNTFLKENDNEVTPTAIKLVNQYGRDINKIGFFYNTFYFAENKIVSTSRYNFFTEYLAASDGSTTGTQYFKEHIYFQYNNCYSYDTDCPGKDAFVGRGSGDGDNVNFSVVSESSNNANFCPNNFWSQYDLDNNKTKSVFAFSECANTFTNVKTQVCETTASGPASLIVKGSAMNTGAKLSIEDIAAKTGIELTDKESKSDRYLIGVRPKDDTWTIGAYQSKDNIDTKLIYWVGVTDDWDDRNNWEYETEVDGKMVRQRVSCVNNFSEDLKVVIEEIGTVEVAGGRKWPQVPASFTENRTNSEYDEHVSAGLGTGKTPTKFASTIELEYGAGIRGVENLREADGTLRYDRAITHFEAERNKWLLVGPVVRPFVSGNSGTTRDVISNDYFKNFEPHIYMHETTIDGNNVSWNKTFGDLNVPILPNTVFAMQASKDYGPYFDNAEDYLKYEGIEVDDKSPTPFIFTGRFAVEEGQHNNKGNYVYSLENGINLLNNVYPCNLNVQELEKLGTVILYDYEKGSFESTTAKNARVLAVVRSQNGFVFTPHNSDLTLELSQELLTEGSTRTRSGEIVMPSFSLNIDNANTTKPGASNIVISYDEFLGSDESLRNTPKVFTKNIDTPEAYIVNKDAKYSRLVSGKEKVSIPVDIRLLKPMNLTFEKVYNEGYDEVVLVDTKTQKFYNLLKRTYTTDVLSAGDTEGRFYLNLTVSGDDDLDDEGDNPGGDDIVDDDDVTTEVEETIEEADINIYAVDNSIIRVIATGTTLKAIYVNDMAGRTEEFLVDGNFAELQLPVSSGVYTVHVIGDTATKIGKVILK